jgi:hypothetical protein
MQYDEDKIVQGDNQFPDKGHTDLEEYLLRSVEQKHSVNSESVVLTSELLRYFNILMFEADN